MGELPKRCPSSGLTRFIGHIVDCVIALRRRLLDTISLHVLQSIK